MFEQSYRQNTEYRETLNFVRKIRSFSPSFEKLKSFQVCFKILNFEGNSLVMNPLFACSRCFKRYPFEEIFTTANEDMFCNVNKKENLFRFCKILIGCIYNSYINRIAATQQQKAKASVLIAGLNTSRTGVIIKKLCFETKTYETFTSSKSSNACPKCLSNLKMFGKPSACSLCSINAAFKADKCCRCAASERQYGSAIKCEICQQMCAFNREDHRVDGKLHCWLCKLSYKRALAKAKKSDTDKQRQKKRSAEDSSHKASSSHKISGSSHSRGNISKASLSEVPEKIQKTANSGMIPNTDHVVAVQLREQIATLQKKLQQKDGQLLAKDKEVSEIFIKCSNKCYLNVSQKPSRLPLDFSHSLKTNIVNLSTHSPSSHSSLRSRNGKESISRSKTKCEIK